MTIVVGWAVGSPAIVTCQEIQFIQKKAWITEKVLFDFGVDKIANTFVFTGNAAVDTRVMGGILQFTNLYRGSAFRTATTAIRDDQTAILSYETPLTTSLSTIARSSWVLSRDNRAIGLSSLQRLNGVAGLRYAPSISTYGEVFGGVESTTQLGVEATGPIVGASGSVADIALEQLDLSARMLADWHRLDAQRTNADLNLQLVAERSQPDGSYLRLGLAGLGLQRQYLTTMSGGTIPDAVEGRNENRIDGTMDVRYNIIPGLTLGLTSLVTVNGISRSYGQPLSAIPVTSVQRHLEEFDLNIDGSVGYASTKTNVLLMATMFRRTEDNTVVNRFPIDPEDLATLEAQEYQRDNRTSRARVYARGAWMPSLTDTLSAEYTWWMLQYDTPSQANNDDRDELSTIATIRYVRRISDVLSVGLSLGGQFLHTVYLKASRSAFNNTNNVIRLSPFIRFATRDFSMHPLLEVLANYTVYDFEGKGAQAQSYGYRQISYRDSIRIRLTNELRFELPAVVRYFERSTLLWGDFSEIPQAGNLEYLVNTRMFAQPSLAWDVGVGIRWYTFEQKSLIVLPGLSSIIGSIHSWAPEVVVRFRPVSGSTLDVSGWYEFQTLSPTATRELPNLLLKAHVDL